MADGDLQNGVAGAVADRQGNVDGWDLDIAHDACAADVQQTVILCLLRVGQGKGILPRQQRPVIGCRLRQHPVIGVPVQRLHLLRIVGHGPGGVARVPVVADGRIQKQGNACKQREDQRGRGKMFFHVRGSPCCCGALRGVKPPLAAPRAVRGGSSFEENDGGDFLLISECSEICDIRIPSGPSAGADVGIGAYKETWQCLRICPKINPPACPCVFWSRAGSPRRRPAGCR